MKTFTKTLVGTAATLAVAVGSAAPAMAQDRYRDRDGISTSDVVTGALIIGGIAAVAAAASNGNDRYDRQGRDYRDSDYRDRDYRESNSRDRDYRDNNYRGNNGGWYDYGSGRNNYRGGGNPERAVEQCVRAAERQAERWGGGRANVSQIRDVERERGGFEVRGTIAVRSQNNRNGNWGNYRSGYRNNGFDQGSFNCDFRRGRVVDVNFSGLRGL